MVTQNFIDSSVKNPSLVSNLKQNLKRFKFTRLTIFIAIAFFLSVSLFKAFPTLSLWFAIGLFLLGTAHGGIEYKEGKITEASGKFYLYYLCLAFVFATLWVFSPAISFALFLLASAFHFSHSEAHIKTLGVSAILGSLAIYPNETVHYFAMLTGNNIFLAPSQTTLICVGTIALILPILEGLYKGKDGLRIIAWIGVACFLPPVEAVALYFFFFHALAEYLKVASNKNQIKLHELKPFLTTGILAITGGLFTIFAFAIGVITLDILAMFSVAFVMPHIIFHVLKDLNSTSL